MVHLLALIGMAQAAEPLVAIVVVDQEARESGYALEIDGWIVNDALPVDVASDEKVALIDKAGRAELLDLAPGEAWEVTGADGEAWMSKLDEEIRTDLMVVRGSRASIDALAESLGAHVFVEDGRTYLSGEDILLAAPWVEDEVALEVEDVALVRVEEDPAVVRNPGPVVDLGVAAVVPTIGRSVSAGTLPVAAGSVGAAEGTPAEEPEPTAGEADIAQEVAPKPVVDLDAMLQQDRANYAGLHLCRDDVLWLHESGTYGFRGVDGVWTVASPGVVRLLTDEGDVLFRAAIDPERGFCRDVWSPEETGDAMPEGYERFSKQHRKGPTE